MVTRFVHDLDSGILLDMWIPRNVDHVPGARGLVRSVAETVLGDGDRAYDVGVCASETISNAVLHGKGDDVHVFVCTDESCLSVEVSHADSGGLPREQVEGAESGRGLRIVSALADRWTYVVEWETERLYVAFDFDIEPCPDSGGVP